MTLLNPGNEAFIPLLEQYFSETIKVAHPNDSAILKYYRLLFEPVKSILRTDRTLCIGSENFDPEADFLFIWEVKDVIALLSKEWIISEDVIIVCNLETHYHELKMLPNEVFSVYSRLKRNVPELTLKDKDFSILMRSRSEVLINPTSNTGPELFDCKAFVKLKYDAFHPSDGNYSNEYCEVYQLATIIGVQVFTATSDSELTAIKEHIKSNV